MNIFVLDEDPVRAAQMQCDKHVVKMTLETAQILCTVVRERAREGYADTFLYRATHKNHPCTKWAGASRDNYKWLIKHFDALAKEYKYRYGREHKSHVKFGKYLLIEALRVPTGELTPFALAMPDKFKLIGDPVQAYRAYYKYEKAKKFALVYTRRQKPEWLGDEDELQQLELPVQGYQTNMGL